MALSALQREQGDEPSHLLFFNRHRSQALQTRLRMLSVDSWEDVRWGWEDFGIGEEVPGDIGRGWKW